MSTKKIAFLGSGKMATAIAGGMVKKNSWPASDILATDKFELALDQFIATTGGQAYQDLGKMAADADILVLAVKPQDATALFEGLKGLEDKLLVSIAAGIKIEQLIAWSGCQRVIRVMPNTPALVNEGMSVYSSSDAVLDTDKADVQTILEAIGVCFELPESNMDAVTAVSGSGPAFLFRYVESMIVGAAELDLPEEVIETLVVQTVFGAATMLQQKIDTPSRLREAVTSKGGTTAAGLNKLSMLNFENTLAACLKAARDRSIELGAS
ncbi:MAG: pyrroline-5-carboxylate reductase [Lentisphaeria bacterium]|nr:pyrroline-5-carboxylate reductase [Lentisphaeria bacterium]